MTLMRSTTPVLMATLLLAGCGSPGQPPTSPVLAPPQIDFFAGLKLVTLEGENGDVLTSLPVPCGGVGVPVGGAIVMSTRVDLEPDSIGWAARSIASTDGDLMLAIQVAAGAQPNDRIVSGIATGTALTFAGRRMRATFGTVSASIISGAAT